jgi:hypothetical protein
MTASNLTNAPIGRRAITIPDPGAADWQFVLPPGFDWKFVCGLGILVASATVGSRFYGLNIYDNISGNPGPLNNVMYGVPNAQALAAGQSGNMHYVRNGGELITAGQHAILPVPDILLPAGWTIGSACFPLAGDHWSVIRIVLEAYPAVDSV